MEEDEGSGGMSKRYELVHESVSAHCCFGFTIIDTTQPADATSKHVMCECFYLEYAEKILEALNSTEQAET